jgi:lipoprotein-anchoring transpeptidase ErfK/SrfK
VKVIFSLVLVLLFSGVVIWPAQAQGGGVYVVQQGDTLSSIAAYYGTNAYDLAAANGLHQNGWIYAGQQLQIPAAPAFNQAPAFNGGFAQPGYPFQGNFPPPNNFYAPPPPVYAVQPPPVWGQPREPIWTNFDNSRYPPVANPWQQPATFQTPPPAVVYQPVPPVLQPAPGALRFQPPLHIPPAFPPHWGAQGEKWIDVNLTSQTLIAYENQTPVYRARVSSGLPQYPTIAGTFRIYVKYEKADMSGGYGADAYYLPDVPYVMYFHGDYGLHGTYWHNNFGTPMSHGCVNLATPDAQWLFNWAPVGTRVVTHY